MAVAASGASPPIAPGAPMAFAKAAGRALAPFSCLCAWQLGICQKLQSSPSRNWLLLTLHRYNSLSWRRAPHVHYKKELRAKAKLRQELLSWWELRLKSHIPFSCTMLLTWSLRPSVTWKTVGAQSPHWDPGSTEASPGERAQIPCSGPGQSLMKKLRLGSYCLSPSVILSASVLVVRVAAAVPARCRLPCRSSWKEVAACPLCY